MQIPSLENVQVDNLPDECREPWDLMIRQWSQKLERNLLRTKYYDGRNELKNLSIAVPDSMAGISEVVGWPQKSVDALADRIVFDGFVGVGDDSRDPLGLDSILSDNDFDVELPQAIRSALTHSCSFLNVRSAEPEDGLRSKVSVSFRSALYETGLWDYARRGLSDGVVDNRYRPLTVRAGEHHRAFRTHALHARLHDSYTPHAIRPLSCGRSM